MADPKNGKSGPTKYGAQTAQTVNAPQPAPTESSAPAVSSTQTPMTQPLPGEPVPAGTTPMPLAATTDTTVRTDQSTGAILEEQTKPSSGVPLDDTSDKRPYAERMTHGNTPYGSVDLVVPAHPSSYWLTTRAMVDEVRQHAATTHGLASDKLLFEKIVAFLTMQLDDATLDKSSAGAKTPEERIAMTREGRTDGQAKAAESNKNRMVLSDHDQLKAERGQELKHEPPSASSAPSSTQPKSEPDVPLSERARADAASAKLHEPPAGLTEPPPPPPTVAGTT